MSELKRYDPSCDDVTIGSMDEELEGDYVEYADYARLKAAADEIAETLKGFKANSKWIPELGRFLSQQAEAALAGYKEATR